MTAHLEEMYATSVENHCSTLPLSYLTWRRLTKVKAFCHPSKLRAKWIRLVSSSNRNISDIHEKLLLRINKLNPSCVFLSRQVFGTCIQYKSLRYFYKNWTFLWTWFDVGKNFPTRGVNKECTATTKRTVWVQSPDKKLPILFSQIDKSGKMQSSSSHRIRPLPLYQP